MHTPPTPSHKAVSQPKHHSSWLHANSYQEQPARLIPALINTNHHALQCLQYVSISSFLFFHLLTHVFYCCSSPGVSFPFMFLFLMSFLCVNLMIFMSTVCSGLQPPTLFKGILKTFKHKLVQKTAGIVWYDFLARLYINSKQHDDEWKTKRREAIYNLMNASSLFSRATLTEPPFYPCIQNWDCFCQ